MNLNKLNLQRLHVCEDGHGTFPVGNQEGQNLLPALNHIILSPFSAKSS